MFVLRKAVPLKCRHKKVLKKVNAEKSIPSGEFHWREFIYTLFCKSNFLEWTTFLSNIYFEHFLSPQLRQQAFSRAYLTAQKSCVTLLGAFLSGPNSVKQVIRYFRWTKIIGYALAFWLHKIDIERPFNGRIVDILRYIHSRKNVKKQHKQKYTPKNGKAAIFN